MGEKQPLVIPAWRGINETHARDIGQPSNGKNFCTVNGRLKTRPGLTLISGTPFTTKIKSMHSARVAQVAERFVVECEDKVFTKTPDEEWFERSTNVGSNHGFTSAIWRDTMILAGGSTMAAYSLDGDSYWENFTYGGETAPHTQGTATFKDRVFLFGPNFAPANSLRFCGYSYVYDPETQKYTEEIDDIDISDWPEDFNIRLTDGGEIVGVVNMGTSLLCLTTNGYWHLYGSTEDDFEVIKSGSTGAYDICCTCVVADIPIWLGADKKVYIFNGSTAEHISLNIDAYLSEAISNQKDYVKCYAVDSQFWVVIPFETTSKAFVFDFKEKEWFIYEFPIVVTAMCKFEKEWHIGTNAGAIYKLIDGVNDNGNYILTELEIGPIDMDSVKLKLKSFWLKAKANNDFAINVYSEIDNESAVLQEAISFSNGDLKHKQIKFKTVKGKNVRVKLTSNDLINSLDEATLIVSPGYLK